jgi:hypothetical protein
VTRWTFRLRGLHFVAGRDAVNSEMLALGHRSQVKGIYAPRAPAPMMKHELGRPEKLEIDQAIDVELPALELDDGPAV